MQQAEFSPSPPNLSVSPHSLLHQQSDGQPQWLKFLPFFLGSAASYHIELPSLNSNFEEIEAWKLKWIPLEVGKQTETKAIKLFKINTII
jgi:hypothetical protein